MANHSTTKSTNMNRFKWPPIALALACLGIAVSVGVQLTSDLHAYSWMAPTGDELRQEAEKHYRDGNYKDALVAFKQLCLDPNTNHKAVAVDLQKAGECIRLLNQYKDLDQIIEETVKTHPKNWRLLQMAARLYNRSQTYGYMISGKFERGYHRGGGKVANSNDRDRARAMQLMELAAPLVGKDSTKTEHGKFYLNFASMITSREGYNAVWRFQTLTDLKNIPDFEDGYYRYRGATGAAVDEDGKPVVYGQPKSWEAATNDGERWRWCLSQAIEHDPSTLNPVRMQRVSFSRFLFGVTSMQRFGMSPFWGRGSSSDQDDENESGVYAIHTLKDTESIAKLATGIKRFDLPKEYNFIELLNQIIDEPETGSVSQAFNTLGQIYEDRRQYETAVEVYRKKIKTLGNDRHANQRIDQIVKNWGRFEPTKMQSSGSKMDFNYRFRNGDHVDFVATKVDVPRLLKDVREYIRTKPTRIAWNRINIANLGYTLLTQPSGKKYLTKETIKWDKKLSPRKKHMDRISTIEFPNEKAGAFLVEANMKDGNSTKIVMWQTDTVLVSKPLNQEGMYFVADAKSGKPVKDLELDFFGYRTVRNKKNRNETEVIVKEFTRRSDETGIVKVNAVNAPSGYNWIVEASSKDRFAYLGFQGIWFGRRYDQQYNQTKTFVVTDRPVYRPENEMKVKAWIRNAQYDKESISQYANKSYTVRINNPKGQKQFEQKVKTDKYGGFEFAYTIPKDATLGVYSIYLPGTSTQLGGNTFRIEEYKKPEFEVSIDAPKEPVMLGEKIKATIQAKYYFGSPVTQATVKYKITRNTYDMNWYPGAYWDWCYSPGYWWFCYDTPWYPGWSNWKGCSRPAPWWDYRYKGPPEVISEAEVPIGEDGTIEVEIDTALAKELQGKNDHEYNISAEVRDQSRRTILGSGKVLVARKPFKVFSWLDRGYYKVGDTITANLKGQTIDKKPIQGKGKLTLFSVSYDKDQKPVEKSIRTWDVDTNADGVASQQFKGSEPGQYRLSYKLTDSADHEIEGGFLFTVTGDGFDGSEFRFNHVELIPEKKEYGPSETVKLQINTEQENSTVLLFVRPTNGMYVEPKVINLKGKSTLYEFALSKKDMPNFFIEAMTISNGNVHNDIKEIVVPPSDRVVNVEVLPNQKEYLPGEQASVEFRLTDQDGKPFVGSTAVSIYDKSVEYISGGSNVPEIREFYWKWRRRHNKNQQTNVGRYFGLIYQNGITNMADLGAFGNSVALLDEEEAEGDSKKASDAVKSKRAPMASRQMNSAMAGEVADMAGAASGPGGGGRGFGGGGGGGGGFVGGKSPAGPGGAAPLKAPTVRKNFADTALFLGTLDTNNDGVATVKLKMPENLTAWKINMWAVGHGTQVGQGSTEVVTRKNLIVRLQAPRFFVEKDEVTLSALVHNYLDTEKTVQVKLEMDGNYLQPIDNPTTEITVPANGEKRVNWRCNVLHEGNATIRMMALTDEESDAMEVNLPVKVHGILKTESWAGTVRPEDQNSVISIRVPAERKVEQSRLEIRYSPSLAFAMVDALPYMSDYPYGCTEQTLNRWLPVLVTQKTLLELKVDLDEVREKISNLNAQEIGEDKERARRWKAKIGKNPIYDETKIVDMINTGLDRLKDMQCPDGGWGWFSGLESYSSPHTTAVVVHGLQLAKSLDAPVPDSVLNRGLNWLKAYQANEVQKIKNYPGRVKPYKPKADNLDAFVYMVLNDSEIDDREMREFLYRDRNSISVYSKALFGLALLKVEDQKKLDMILKNIDQYVVQDAENETAYLNLGANNYWWYWYGSENEAMAAYLKLLSRTDPKGKTAPRLVKYLLNNRKHGTYWLSTRDTAFCVEAFSEYIKRSGENAPDMTVELYVDGEKRKEVEINRENLFYFDNKFVLEGKAVTDGEHKIEIRRKGTGPVYFNAYLTNFTMENYIKKAGLEVKVDREYYKLVRVEKTDQEAGTRGQPITKKREKYDRIKLKDMDEIVSGDLIEVELTIQSKNDYEYLLFEDLKPSGFEPDEVRSGYTKNEMRAYVEFRDDRVGFFIEKLARGTHSVSYRMRAENPGRFSALPAQASAMYAPELKGNSDEIKLRVVDKE